MGKNGSKDIGPSLENRLIQKLRNIVVDNASTDDSLTTLRKTILKLKSWRIKKISDWRKLQRLAFGVS